MKFGILIRIHNLKNIVVIIGQKIIIKKYITQIYQ